MPQANFWQDWSIVLAIYLALLGRDNSHIGWCLSIGFYICRPTAALHLVSSFNQVLENTFPGVQFPHEKMQSEVYNLHHHVSVSEPCAVYIAHMWLAYLWL